MKKSELRNIIREEVKKLNESDDTKLKQAREFLKPFLTGLTPVKSIKHPESIFYKKDGKILFELDKRHGKSIFNVDYDLIWKVLLKKYGLFDSELKSLIKTEAEAALKISGISPFGLYLN